MEILLSRHHLALLQGQRKWDDSLVSAGNETGWHGGTTQGERLARALIVATEVQSIQSTRFIR